MSTVKSEPSRGSLEADSIDWFFATAEDDSFKSPPEPKPEPIREEFKPIQRLPPAANAAYQDDEYDYGEWWTKALRGFSILCFVAAIAMYARGYFLQSSTASTHTVNKPILASLTQPAQPVTTKIEDIRLGTRVLGENPIDSQAETVEPTPESWREVHLEMTKHSGAMLWIELLRPLTWIEQHNASLGNTVHLEMHSMGAVGDAAVTFVGPCPKVQSGEGTIVTGTFKHQADDSSKVVRLRLEGQEEATGVTANHRYWSIDRQDFVEVGKLKEGERVDTANGESRVVSITQDQYTGFLYNLETMEHVYRVGTLGTLVHNDCLDYAKIVQRRRPDGSIIRMEPLPPRSFQTGQLPGYPVAGRHGMRDLASGDRHFFHLENGILRDPAHPRGIPIDDWIAEYSRLNNISPDEVLDFFNFLPYMGK